MVKDIATPLADGTPDSAEMNHSQSEDGLEQDKPETFGLQALEEENKALKASLQKLEDENQQLKSSLQALEEEQKSLKESSQGDGASKADVSDLFEHIRVIEISRDEKDKEIEQLGAKLSERMSIGS